MNTNTTIALPDVVARYIDAANRFDAESAAACFEPDAKILDEAKTHVGTDAIRNWVAHSSELYQAHISVLSAQRDEASLTVSALVAGQFPGSPAELHFSFLLGAEKINRLSIQ